MKLYLSIFIALICLFPSFSFAYEATCTFEYGLVNSGTFEISVYQGTLAQKFNSTSRGRNSIYKFKNKIDEVFCYQTGNEYSDDMFDYGLMCVGKFDNGKFSFSLMGNDGTAYGRCSLSNQSINRSTRGQTHVDKDIRVPEAARLNGFIALSDIIMSWTDAVTWCQQQGGRLPSINNSASLALGDVPIVQVKRYLESSSMGMTMLRASLKDL